MSDALLGRAASLYRIEALRARASELDAEALPRFAPPWARRFLLWACTPLLLAPLVLALPIDDTVAGAARVRAVGAHELRADGAATIAALEVHAGARVRKGEVLLRLSDAGAAAQLPAAFADYRAALLMRLSEPHSESNAAQVAQARERYERLAREASSRAIRAPIDGTVLESNVVAGQAVQAAQELVTIAPEPTRYALEITVPARHRAQLEAGQAGSFVAASAQPLRLAFRLAGGIETLPAEKGVVVRAELEPGRVYAGQTGRASVTLGRLHVAAWLWRALQSG